MRSSFIFCLFFLFSSSLIFAERFTWEFDKVAFYNAISKESEEAINAEINLVKTAAIPEKEAYEGALLMKKAGVIKGSAKQRLSLFKAGRAKLEAAIAKDNNNIEFRFLRLIIQENSPKIVKYKSDVEQDSQLVKANFKNLPQYLQQVISDYSKSSKVLKIG